MSWWDDAPLVDRAKAAAPPGESDGKWWEGAPLAQDAPKNEVPLPARPFVGVNRAIAGMVGAPVDAATWAINNSPGTLLVNKGAEALGFKPPIPKIENPIGGSESIKRGMGLINANPDDVRPAETFAEKMLESAGEGAASMLIPGLGAEAALARSWKAGETLGSMALNIIRGTGAASNTAIGAAGGALGEVAAESAPEGYENIARLAGNVVGGGVVAAGQSAAEAGVRAAGGALRSAIEPAELAAARQIVARADNPGTFRQNVADAADTPQLVPGSQPTTFQATGDLGVGALEREVAASPKGVPRFAERRVEQNTSRVEALERISNPAANSDDVATYVRARLQGLTDDFDGRVGAARGGLDDALTRAGGRAADNEAGYGEALRGPLTRLEKEAEQAEDVLWRAIDADKKTLVNPEGLRKAAADMEDAIPRTAKGPAGDEDEILDAIFNLDGKTTFGEIIALRSRLTEAMRAERKEGSPTVLRRLNIMLGEVDNTLARTAGDVASDPSRRAVIIDNLRTHAGTWQDETAQAGLGNEGAAARTVARAGSQGEGVAPPPTGGVPPGPGAPGAGRGEPSLPPGDQGVPGIAPEVADRYAAARAATRELKTTFGEGPVGGVLAPGAQYGSFKTTASNVAGKLFDRPESLQAYVKAAGDDPAAISAIQDYAAFSLRQAAVKDGMLSPPKYQKWVDDHAYVLRQFPEMEKKFANVSTAQAALDDAMASQKQALKDYQTSAVTRLIGGDEPAQVVGKAMGSPGQFTALVNLVKDDPAALAGLKRATVEFMMSKAMSTAEAGASGVNQINAATLQKFYLQNRRALATLFNEDELANIVNVAADLRQANRSIVAVKIPGGSNTTQDQWSSRLSVVQNVISKNMGAAGGGLAGSTMGPIGSVAGAIAGAAADALRAARVDRIDKAVVEMMLDPKVAAPWLAKVPADTPAAASSFARRLRAATANQVMQAIEEEGGESAAGWP